MIRSINIFKSTSKEFPIRIEFWDTDKLITVYQVNKITKDVSTNIENFITGNSWNIKL